MRRLALILSLTLPLACAAQTRPVEGPGIWRLIALNGAQPSGPITLVIEEGRISGEAPCNRYSGTLAVEGDSFLPGPVAATKRACDRLEEEAAYFAALSAVTTREQHGITLVLTGPDGVRLDFTMPMN